MEKCDYPGKEKWFIWKERCREKHKNDNRKAKNLEKIKTKTPS